MLSELFYHPLEDGPEYIRRGCCQFAAYTARAPGKQSDNEDCAGWIRLPDDRWVFMVADGLGGLPLGATASKLAIENILSRLLTMASGEDLRGALLDGIDIANEAILSSATGAATTLVAVEFSTMGMRPYHIGDSTILVTGQRGAIKYQSISHSPTGYLKEAGMLDDTEAMLHEERHIVYNVLGSNEMRLEIGPQIPLARFDTILLASDGLHDNLSQERVLQGIRSGQLDDAVLSLAMHCREIMGNGNATHQGHPDDLTMVGIRRNR